MKIFYNSDGKVIGTVDASPAIEAKIYIEGSKEMAVPKAIAKRLLDPNDELEHSLLQVKKNKIVEVSPKPKKLQAKETDVKGYATSSYQA